MSLYTDVGGFDRILALCKGLARPAAAGSVGLASVRAGITPDARRAPGGVPRRGVRRSATLHRRLRRRERDAACPAGDREHAELDEAGLVAFDMAVSDIGLTGDVARRVSGYFRRAT